MIICLGSGGTCGFRAPHSSMSSTTMPSPTMICACSACHACWWYEGCLAEVKAGGRWLCEFHRLMRRACINSTLTSLWPDDRMAFLKRPDAAPMTECEPGFCYNTYECSGCNLCKWSVRKCNNQRKEGEHLCSTHADYVAK